MEKLLILGNSIGTRDAINYARSLGVRTIVTDYLPLEQSPEKKMADEYWMIDVQDLDALERKCREEGVTGVFAATGESCLKQVGKLCRRLGLPFYASESSEKAAYNKKYFKDTCRLFGLDTPREYSIEDDVSGPVIIKPVDSTAQQGLSVCRSREEIQRGYEKAMAVSQSGSVVIEDYLEGNEMDCMYVFRDGVPFIVAIGEMTYFKVNGRNNFGRLLFYSQYSDKYLETTDQKVRDMLKYLDCRKGMVYLQFMRYNGKFYFLEMVHRLDATGSWRVAKKLTGVSILEWQVQLALGRRPEETIPEPRRIQPDGMAGMSIFVWGKAGKVTSIEGLEQVKAMAGVEIFQENISVGTEILPVDNMRQIAYIICLTAEAPEKLEELVGKVKESLHAYDEAGEDLLLYP